MRLLAAVLFVVTWFSVNSAQSVQESMVTLFKEICVASATPEAMMVAGENLASARGWKLDQAKSGRMPLMIGERPPGLPESPSDPHEPRPIIAKIWEGYVSTGVPITMVIMIAGPEQPELRYTVCSFHVAGQLRNEAAREISRLLPSFTRSKVSIYSWYPYQDGQNDNDCSKNVLLSAVDNSTMLSFVDLKFPEENRGRQPRCK